MSTNTMISETSESRLAHRLVECDQRRHELLRRRQNLKELLHGEADDDLMVGWRHRQLATIANDLLEIEQHKRQIRAELSQRQIEVAQ